MRISKKTEYTIHSLLIMALSPERTFLLDELAKQGVSRDYLAKCMRALSEAKIVISAPGVKGGYKLAKKSSEISLAEVLTAAEGDIEFKCNYVERKCDAYGNCEIINPFKEAFKSYLETLDKTKLSDLVDETAKTNFKLDWAKV